MCTIHNARIHCWLLADTHYRSTRRRSTSSCPFKESARAFRLVSGGGGVRASCIGRARATQNRRSAADGRARLAVDLRRQTCWRSERFSRAKAISCYYDYPEHVRELMLNAMRSDYGWHNPGQDYLNI
jgi:hypothetical protein